MQDRWIILSILLGLTAFLAMIWLPELRKRKKR